MLPSFSVFGWSVQGKCCSMFLFFFDGAVRGELCPFLFVQLLGWLVDWKCCQIVVF